MNVGFLDTLGARLDQSGSTDTAMLFRLGKATEAIVVGGGVKGLFDEQEHSYAYPI